MTLFRKIVFGVVSLFVLFSVYLIILSFYLFNQASIVKRFTKDAFVISSLSNNAKDSVRDTVWCSQEADIQLAIDTNDFVVVALRQGIHKTVGLKMKDNQTFYIPKGATLILNDNVVINRRMLKEAEGHAVIKVHGSSSRPMDNFKLHLDGVIDGNKVSHPYENGGVEGVDFKYVVNSEVIGSGAIVNCNGDGIDIDASENCLIKGINLFNNDGGGIHFGSPRPISGSQGNVVLRCNAYGNGYLHKRAGFDQSWPNKGGVSYYFCYSDSNFVDWEIKGSESIVVSDNLVNESGDNSFEGCILLCDKKKWKNTSEERINGTYLVLLDSAKSDRAIFGEFHEISWINCNDQYLAIVNYNASNFRKYDHKNSDNTLRYYRIAFDALPTYRLEIHLWKLKNFLLSQYMKVVSIV